MLLKPAVMGMQQFAVVRNVVAYVVAAVGGLSSLHMQQPREVN
jgi:hypothetical protein